MKKLNFNFFLFFIFLSCTSTTKYYVSKNTSFVKLEKDFCLFYPSSPLFLDIFSKASYLKKEDTFFIYSKDTCSNLRIFRSTNKIDTICIINKYNNSFYYYLSEDINSFKLIGSILKINKADFESLYIKYKIGKRMIKISKDIDTIVILNNINNNEFTSLIPYFDTAKYLIRNDSLILLTKHENYAPFYDYYVLCNKKCRKTPDLYNKLKRNKKKYYP